MEMLTSALLAPLPILVVIAALTDLTRMKIPNWISASLVLTFFAAAIVTGLTPLQIGLNVGVGLLLLLAGMALFALRIVGGGDAKLLAAAGMWLGASSLAPFLIWTAILGGLLSLALILGRSFGQPYLTGAPAWMSTLFEPKGDIPYGVAICGGVLMAYPASTLVTHAFGS